MVPKFLVDANAGKLAKWLRMMGCDAAFFGGRDDGLMITQALAEHRIILTRDTQVGRRRVVTNGGLKVVLLKDDKPASQLRQIVKGFDLAETLNPFSRCLEDNTLLQQRGKEEVKELVPPYVFGTQDNYMQCPSCHRVYWRGTHWQAMARILYDLTDSGP